MSSTRRPRRKVNGRLVFLIAMIPVAALFVGMIVGLGANSVSPPAPQRTTHEQLFEAAGKPDAAPQYDYYFSQEELERIAPNIKPYDCDPSRSLTDADKYHCGVDQLFTLDSMHFIPDGYMYEGALMGKESHTLKGIRIVRQAPVQGT
jgi:hypothetical protein